MVSKKPRKKKLSFIAQGFGNLSALLCHGINLHSTDVRSSLNRVAKTPSTLIKAEKKASTTS